MAITESPKRYLKRCDPTIGQRAASRREPFAIPCKFLPQSRSGPADKEVRHSIQRIDLNLKIRNAISKWSQKDLDDFLLPESIVALHFCPPGTRILEEKQTVKAIFFPAEPNLGAPCRSSSGYAFNQRKASAFGPGIAEPIQSGAIPGFRPGTENFWYAHRHVRRLACIDQFAELRKKISGIVRSR